MQQYRVNYSALDWFRCRDGWFVPAPFSCSGNSRSNANRAGCSARRIRRAKRVISARRRDITSNTYDPHRRPRNAHRIRQCASRSRGTGRRQRSRVGYGVEHPRKHRFAIRHQRDAGRRRSCGGDWSSCTGETTCAAIPMRSSILVTCWRPIPMIPTCRRLRATYLARSGSVGRSGQVFLQADWLRSRDG